jgi:isoleucyl-tRNA synthetase
VPYRQVATAGWVLDAEGRAMSKSLGNVVAPQEIWKKYGAEILRLWIASVDFREDMWYSDLTMTRLADAYRKIRNTFRFALSNLYDFSPERDMVAAEGLPDVDRWALLRTAELIDRCRGWYDEQMFHKVYHSAYDFCTVQLSSFYFDVLKDRLYTSPPASQRRRAAQTAFYLITEALLRLLAPIMAFTCDEAWRQLPARAGALESVHLADLPRGAQLTAGITAEHQERLKDWDRLIQVRSEVLKALEAARNSKLIGSGLAAKVVLAAGKEWAPLLHQHAAELPMLFIVSQVELAGEARPGTVFFDLPGVHTAVERAAGTKCERCWNYSTRVGENKEYPTVCERCSAALAEMSIANC